MQALKVFEGFGKGGLQGLGHRFPLLECLKLP